MQDNQAYLEALGITQWVPRAQSATNASSSTPSEHTMNVSDTTHARAVETEEPRPTSSPIDLNDTEAMTQQQFSLRPIRSTPEPGALWMVCQQGADLPRESFVTRGKPSKTISSMLRAIDWLMNESHGRSFSIELAELVSGSAGDAQVHLADLAQQFRPAAILVLGENTANSLFAEQRSMPEHVARTWVIQGVNAMVTYHPYQLYSDPLLKKQTFQHLLTLPDLVSASKLV